MTPKRYIVISSLTIVALLAVIAFDIWVGGWVYYWNALVCVGVIYVHARIIRRWIKMFRPRLRLRLRRRRLLSIRGIHLLWK